MFGNLSKKPWGALAASAITLPVMLYGRGYPWHLAMAVAAAVGFLTYMSLSAAERLARLYRRKSPPEREP